MKLWNTTPGRRSGFGLWLGLGFSLGVASLQSGEIPEAATRVLDQYCYDCHSGSDPEGDVQLEVPSIDWMASGDVGQWERVYRELRDESMPPTKADPLPQALRAELLHWLEGELTANVPVGGTLPRRLNRTEYENTIRAVFELPEFQVPDSFPNDDFAHGFDNNAEGLILSPPLLAAYLDLATQVADAVLPPEQAPEVPVVKSYPVGATGLATGEGAGAALAGDHFRLASSRNMASAAGWPARFEAPQSGIYRLTLTAAAFQTEAQFYPHRSKPFRLGVYARPSGEQMYDFFDGLRLVAEVEVPTDVASLETTVEVALFENDLFGLRWIDGPAYSGPGVREFSKEFLAERLVKDRRYYAAMLKVRGGHRGISQREHYELTLAAKESPELDLKDPRLDTLPEKWGGGLSDAPHNWIKSFVLEEMHRHGPALDVWDVHVEGPIRLVVDDATREQQQRTARFLNRESDAESKAVTARRVLASILPKLFRRPIESELLATYVSLAESLWADDPSVRVDDALHLALRRALMSPRFLYRSVRPGVLDTYDLASRLSYFLTSGPPDAPLLAKAADGTLGDSEVLAAETRRLAAGDASQAFVHGFTSQWLGTRHLKDIMPDPRLLAFFDADRERLIQETELFFEEILKENHSIETFIDPDFSYRSEGLNKIYGGELKGYNMRRVSFDKGGRHGGILGMGSVMMATANGVDTQPILRGVWILENVFGTPPPPPPDNVPAIAPDTTGATTMREMLDRHRADASCARCHEKMDPLGMVMENFDPVGRWRDYYPVYADPASKPLKEEFYKNIGKGTYQGPAVDALGMLPDGTRFEDVRDLKRYLVENVDLFSRCLTEKLLVYATGRGLGFGDRRVVEGIVSEVRELGNGFQDLLVVLVQSEAFRTR